MRVIPLGVDDGFRAADRPAGARPDPGDGQRRRADEGHRHAAGGLRQAAHRARRPALVLVSKPQPGGRTEQLVDQLAHRRPRALRARRQRRRARRDHGLGRGGVRALALRGVLAADRRADGLRAPRWSSRAPGRSPRSSARTALCADLVTPGDVGELARPSRRCSTTPSVGERYGAAGRARVDELFSWRAVGRGDRRGVRGASTARARGSTSERSAVLTVDFDRLGLRPGDRVLDMGCGAGRHAFEMYRRGADVVAFDQDADELSGVRDVVRRDARRRRGARRGRGRRQGGRRARRCRSPTASSTGSWRPRCSSTSRPTSRRSPSWSGCCARAAPSR